MLSGVSVAFRRGKSVRTFIQPGVMGRFLNSFGLWLSRMLSTKPVVIVLDIITSAVGILSQPENDYLCRYILSAVCGGIFPRRHCLTAASGIHTGMLVMVFLPWLLNSYSALPVLSTVLHLWCVSDDVSTGSSGAADTTGAMPATAGDTVHPPHDFDSQLSMKLSDIRYSSDQGGEVCFGFLAYCRFSSLFRQFAFSATSSFSCPGDVTCCCYLLRQV